MSTSRKTILAIAGFAVFLILATVAYNALTNASAGGRTPAIAGSGAVLQTVAPRTAPAFTVYDSAGKAVKLSDFAGKPVILNFWASWCPPCKSEMPLFDKIYKEMNGEVSILMVDLVDGQRETQAKGQEYVQQQGFAFAPLFDIGQGTASKYSITAIPTTYFISAKGQIVYSYRGAIEEKTLREAIALVRK